MKIKSYSVKPTSNNYLQYIIGGYKCTLRIALKRKVTILSLNLYVKVTVLQRVVKVINYPVKHNIKIAVNNIQEVAQELII